MSDKRVEKKFLYLILLSVTIHAAAFTLLLNMPEEKAASMAEPLLVDLDGIPAYAPPRLPAPPVERPAEDQQRAEKEIVPKAGDVRMPAPVLRPPAAISAPPPSSDPDGSVRTSRDELFRKKGSPKISETASFYPGAEKMERLEESYRQKYGSEVAQGETRFLNTDDIQFGSFLRRFENSIYGVWRYPAEAAKMGIEGITPVRITFNRRGEIVGRELLQSSGSKILDSEVLRTLDQVGPIGAFPKGYDKDTINFIAFFHYGIIQGAKRSLR